MANFIDYLNWRGDITFDMVPFNVVDAMILCELSYYNYDGLVSSDFEEKVLLKDICVKQVLDPLPNYCTKEDLILLEMIRDSARFADVPVSGFVNKVDEAANMQFSAITFFPEKRKTFVAFRGTDDSLVGWKENMDLAYNDFVPSQKEAVLYLKEAAASCHGQILVGGHSKGGNLAIYGSAFSGKRVGKRIEAVYNFDGPGFNDKVIQDERFIDIAAKTHTFVPQDSIIGLLLKHKEKYSVIHSTASNGASQHHLYTWEVTRDNFIREEKITKSGENYRENISEWINSMTYEEKQEFIKVVYDLVDDYKTTGELFTLKNIWGVIKEYRAMSDDDKHIVTGAFGDLKDTIIDNVKEKIDKISRNVQNSKPVNILKTGKDIIIDSLGKEEGSR